MSGAKESPFSKGRYPITPVQLDVFVDMVAEYAETYDIPIDRQHVLTHAEVEPTLNVWQRGKWDITWLPGMAKTGDPIEVGDHIRELITAKQRGLFEQPDTRMAATDIDDFSKELAKVIGDFMKSRVS